MKPLFFALVLVPTLAFAAKAWGPPPENYVAKLDAHLQEVLKDRDSVKTYAITAPMQCRDTLHWGSRPWCSCIRLNAKNSYGGYTGIKTDVAFFDEASGEIYSTFDARKLGMAEKCEAAAWQDRDPAVLATAPR